MKINTNACVYGKDIVLIPYLDKHISARHAWLCAHSGNRLDRSAEPPTLAQESKTQKQLVADKKRCTFLVADAEVLGDPEYTENDALLGEAHLVKKYDGEDEHAAVEIMLTDRSVRRRALICESLLLLLLYGVDTLALRRFSVEIDPNADPQTENRVLFAARGDDGGSVHDMSTVPPPDQSGVTRGTDGGKKEVPTDERKDGGANNGDVPTPLPTPIVASTTNTASPSRKRKSSKRGVSIKRAVGIVSESIKKVFSRRKTDYLARLTRHLLKEDEGEHWPQELDFELVAPYRIELDLNVANEVVFRRCVAHAKRIKYSSVVSDGSVRKAQDTRIDGRTVILVPYSREHVPVVHRWMQQKDMCSSMGVQAPTLDMEKRAQKMMEKDSQCHPFVVCSKVDVGNETCPVHPEGRAQIVITSKGVAQIHVGIVQADTKLRDFMHREVLLLLMMYIRQTLPVETVTMMADTALRPQADAREDLWSRRLEFETSEDGTLLSLDIEANAVKLAMRRLTRGMVVRGYNAKDVVYEDGTMA